MLLSTQETHLQPSMTTPSPNLWAHNPIVNTCITTHKLWPTSARYNSLYL